MPDIYRLGACTVYQDGASCIPQASTQRPLDEGEDETEVEDLGQVPVACALGVTALPAPPDDNGTAEGVVLEGVGGLTGTCVAAWDVRCAGVVGQMSPGDTALHGTHTDATKRAVTFCKENSYAVVVGGGGEKQVILSLDRENSLVMLSAFGGLIQWDDSELKIVAPGGKAMIVMTSAGLIQVLGNVFLGNSSGAALPIALGNGASAVSTSVTASP